MADVDKDILAKLVAQEKEEGTLPLLLQFYRELLRIQFKVKEKIGVPGINVGTAAPRDRIEQGKPLLGFADLTLELPLLRELFVEVVAIYAKYQQLFGKIPERLTSPESKRLLTKKAIKAWFMGEKLPTTLTSGDLNPELIQAIFHSTIKPVLTSYAESLAHVVDQERWRRRYCPICGGRPDFSFLEKESGARWLVCSRCDMEWVFQRLECPFCGCQEQGALGYLTDEDELYRLYTCERCNTYLKAIDLRKYKENDILLPLERLLTIDMDRQAQEKGLVSR